MKLLSNRARLFFCALLIPCYLVCFLTRPLLAVSSGATHHFQQTHAADGAQQTDPRSDGSGDALKFPVTVTSAKGGFLIGLTKENFSVWEGKTQREITYFSSVESPASVGVLIDVSGSVDPRTLEAARAATARFIKQGYEKNEYLIGEFNNSWRASSGWRPDAPSALEALNSLAANGAQAKQKPRGPTALYDAWDAALDELAVRPNARHILLLFTDGQDNQSRISLERLRRKIKMSDVLIYSIHISRPGEVNAFNNIGDTVLDELTAISGGRAFFPEYKKDSSQLGMVIDMLALELRHQYVVGFTPTNAAPAGKWNKVKIKHTSPDQSLKNLYLRTREGYFSPTPAPLN